jgi:hypothetical protein
VHRFARPAAEEELDELVALAGLRGYRCAESLGGVHSVGAFSCDGRGWRLEGDEPARTVVTTQARDRPRCPSLLPW